MNNKKNIWGRIIDYFDFIDSSSIIGQNIIQNKKHEILFFFFAIVTLYLTFPFSPTKSLFSIPVRSVMFHVGARSEK